MKKTKLTQVILYWSISHAYIRTCVLDELEALDTTNVIEGGRRTRGVRVDYSKMKYDEEEEEEEEEELQGEEEEENQEEVYEVDGEDKAVEANEEDTQNIEKGTNGHDEDEDEEEE